MVLSGKDTEQGVKRALDQLFANADTDLVLALGTIASSEVLRRKELPKPVVAPFVLDSLVQQLPPEEAASGVANLAYIDSMFYMDREIMSFQKIVPFKNLAALVDQREVSAIDEISQHARQLANEHTMTVHVVPVGNSAEETLAAIPTGTEAVMVGPLYHYSEDESEKLIKGLIDKGLPGYSTWRRKQVEQGLLAGEVPKDGQEKLARMAAVTVQGILLGEEPGSLTVAFTRSRELTINMATARALDIYPSLGIMTGANLLNEQRVDIECSRR